jgi:hypothetical protein
MTIATLKLEEDGQDVLKQKNSDPRINKFTGNIKSRTFRIEIGIRTECLPNEPSQLALCSSGQ